MESLIAGREIIDLKEFNDEFKEQILDDLEERFDTPVQESCTCPVYRTIEKVESDSHETSADIDYNLNITSTFKIIEINEDITDFISELHFDTSDITSLPKHANIKYTKIEDNTVVHSLTTINLSVPFIKFIPLRSLYGYKIEVEFAYDGYYVGPAPKVYATKWVCCHDKTSYLIDNQLTFNN